jgi:hypothetical protein
VRSALPRIRFPAFVCPSVKKLESDQLPASTPADEPHFSALLANSVKI